ncbi:MAG: MMPL family transporter [Desulfobacterales bacterium]|uniref:MMPL family transporter n=1 Tax=Candidatus Desulfatibia vada TaxID=2841696 RepID=A0A8J6TM17_9BACT|nr:MMPL family transporter [Candidatus Desulfatibia vada]
MKLGSSLIQFSIKKPKLVIAIMVLATLMLGAMISMVRVDTDPENMLSEHEAVRIFHDQVKKEFSLYDVVVVGVVNETHPDGVFNPTTLKRVKELTEFSQKLTDPKDPEKRVVSRDVIAPGNVDTIEQAGPGRVRFQWLMSKAPTTRAEALKIRDSAMANPLYKGTLVSEDGKAMGIYLPITSKDFAYQVRERLLEKIESFDDVNGDDYYITGLPVAEDTFGVEMFVQMAISAPLAMFAIFLLLLFFFRKLSLIISPMIIAVMTVICTMGLLIGTGNTLHIMSSMIPIFLMPIAVVDSIHILSEFFDLYQKIKDRRKTLERVMDHLFIPMLYTSLTSSAGFASLALTPIPPVQVFGLFVACGIMLAWLLTILFIPAYVMLMKEEGLAGFGVVAQSSKDGANGSLLSRHLPLLGNFTYRRAKIIVILTMAILMGAVYGISKIQINDNPVKWFKKNHPIRVADRVLNKHFGGTYEAYLVLEGAEHDVSLAELAARTKDELTGIIAGKTSGLKLSEAEVLIDQAAGNSTAVNEFMSLLVKLWEAKMDTADDDSYDFWVDGLDIIDQIRHRDQLFKQPKVLRYVAQLQSHLQKSGVVGKSNSITDVVKKVYQELFEADAAYYRVPDTSNAVAQTLISFQNSHKPDDLWHLITPDYKKANIWVQLKNGDNKDMEEVIMAVDRFITDNPPPVPMKHQWAGLTYLNVMWQNKMVSGMLKSFLSSFAVVFVMMAFLFRSPLWGLLAMVPLSVTIAAIYGIIGLAGKDYDMPVAVLSSLTLGLAVDFAIHFLERSRMAFKRAGSWKEGIKEMFEEPARAISRNVIVIAVGFTPLLAAPLVPYQTVGIFLASIMAISGIATMLILPALIQIFEKQLFKVTKE